MFALGREKIHENSLRFKYSPHFSIISIGSPRIAGLRTFCAGNSIADKTGKVHRAKNTRGIDWKSKGNNKSLTNWAAGKGFLSGGGNTTAWGGAPEPPGP